MTYTRRFADTWLRSLEFQVDAYYNEVENKIVATPTSNFFRWTMVNLGEVEIRGVDAALQTDWQVGKEWFFTGRLNYTYQRAQDFTDPSSEFYGGQIPYIPWHSGSAALTHAGVPGKQLQFYLYGRTLFFAGQYSVQLSVALVYQRFFGIEGMENPEK